jgi:hypothetical protein
VYSRENLKKCNDFLTLERKSGIIGLQIYQLCNTNMSDFEKYEPAQYKSPENHEVANGAEVDDSRNKSKNIDS